MADDRIGSFVSESSQTELNNVLQQLVAIANQIKDINASGLKLSAQTSGAGSMPELVQNTEKLKKNTDDLSMAMAEYGKQANQAAVLNAKLSVSSSEQAKTTTDLRLQLNEVNSQMREEAKVAQAAAGSLNQMRAQLNLMVKEYDAMGKAEREATLGGKALLENIQAQTKAVSELESATGRNQRNVGNYGSALSGVANAAEMVWGALRKVAYIVPGLGIGGIVDMIITALSKIVLQQKEAYDVTEKNAKANKELADSYSGEIAQMRVLYDTAKNTTLSYKERSDAIDELQKKYPDYFGNLNREKILNGEVEASIKAVTNELIRNAEVKAKQSELEDLISKRAQLNIQLQKNVSGETFIYGENVKDVNQGLKDQMKFYDGLIDKKEKDIQATKEVGKFGYFLNEEDRKRFEEAQKRQKALALLTEDERKKLKITSKDKEDKPIILLPSDADLKELQDVEKSVSMIQKMAEEAAKPSETQIAVELTGGTSDKAAFEMKNSLEVYNFNKGLNKKSGEDTETAEEKKQAAIKETWSVAEQAVSEFQDTFFEMQNLQLQKQINADEFQKKLIGDRLSLELNAIDMSMESDLLKAHQKAELNAQALAQEQSIDAHIRQMKRQQAINDKMAAVANVIENTSIAIVKAISEIVWPYDLIVAGLYAGMGAAQIMKITSAPLPAYAKGTKSSGEGPAIVGERGMEAMFNNSGEFLGFTPDEATIAYLKSGTQIIPAEQTKSLLKQMAISDYAGGSIYDSRILDEISKGNRDLLESNSKLLKSNERLIKTVRDSKTDVNFDLYIKSKTGRL